ncbi:hypothetical protein M3Y97_00500300 [Aphelenchoides bicaudatus]|nr:hypothetical protein M3Y97_00500300 [Aphelenchoides bicaudatus]
MKGLYLLRSARIIVCLIVLFGIRFGNYTCVDVSSVAKECAKLESPLKTLQQYDENGEVLTETNSGGAYQWEYMKCKPVSLRKFYTSLTNGDSQSDALANTLYSLVILLSLSQMLAVSIELLLVPDEVKNQGCLLGLLLTFESLFYVSLVVVGYLYYFHWRALIVVDAGYSPFLFNAICALFTISQVIFHIDAFLYIHSSCRTQTVYRQKSSMIESQFVDGSSRLQTRRQASF